MRLLWGVPQATVMGLLGLTCAACGQEAAPLPAGVKAVWDPALAVREATATRERLSVNGLWQWQPGVIDAAAVPTGRWGWFKVPACWPGREDYMQSDYQTLYPHPAWGEVSLAGVQAAWYQRQITVPAGWAGRRIALTAEYVNSAAAVYLDGRKVGEIRFPAGELDLTAAARPGTRQTLSILVVALPLRAVGLSFNDTNSARQVQGSVARRGLCGDLWLVGEPTGPAVGDVKIDPSVRKSELRLDVALARLAAGATYRLRARLRDGDQPVGELLSPAFGAADVKAGRYAWAGPFKPAKRWDIHTPGNQLVAAVDLLGPGDQVADSALPQRFGFREFWIDGKDFYLNGTRLYLSAVPLDNAQVGAALSTYEAAKESLLRLQSFGINFVYTHNYSCEPGTHLSFTEILRAADDVGMLVALSQPHFGSYDWQAADADTTNGYARHAEFYVRVAQNHPAVVAYSTSHNATGYAEDMNPDMIDGISNPRESWAQRNSLLALRAQAIIERLDPSRIVYHHSSGNLGTMHTSNFYPNWVPIQELDDWFEHWSTVGRKPVFLVEYGAPFGWDWTMYRGYYQGRREFGSARVPWEYCLAEWNAQFLGDSAYQISEREATNLRWEAQRFRSGQVWQRWDYPHQVGSRDVEEMHPVQARYTASNWRAFRTWGLSANSPWEHSRFWKLRDGFEAKRRDLPVDWDKLQRPGYSPDFIDKTYQRMDLAFERSDWEETPTTEALRANNGPLLAWLAGPADRFTAKDHSYYPGETVEKQLIVINNSRETVTCAGSWTLRLPTPLTGAQSVTVPTGDQARVPIRLELPVTLAPGTYELTTESRFAGGPTMTEALRLTVIARPAAPTVRGKVALYDPAGDTTKLLRQLGVAATAVDDRADLAGYDLLVIGRGALSVDGPGPDLSRVPAGLKVLVFEQTGRVMEQRLGFRIAEYGLRQAFPRVAGHPALAGLDAELLRDWRGAATLLPPRLSYQPSTKFSGSPGVTWCGMEATRLWRCGNQGNVASVLLEKPARGDFLPLVDGGYALQFSPLLEYREGRGLVLFCQMDVTGRTAAEPAAELLTANLLRYVDGWTPPARRAAIYVGDEAGRRHLAASGIAAAAPPAALGADQVLVVGRGGGRALAPRQAEIGRWLGAGGHVVALGLDAAEANTFLPQPVTTKAGEHLAAVFEPQRPGTAFAGVGPADVHNRDPREVPLVTGGAQPLGNGVLAVSADQRVVFCQLPPYEVSPAGAASPGLVLTPDEAQDGAQGALVTMGTAPLGQVGQKVPAGEIGRTYTFAVLVKPLEGRARVRLEIERAGRPWDRAVRGADQDLAPGKWTELHETFKVDKAYAEGWQAYLYISQATQLRLDRWRLVEGAYSATPAAGATNLLPNPSFEAGVEPWGFRFDLEQMNLRRTWRRSSCLLTRVLANLGVAGTTPLLERFKTPAGAIEGPSVVRNGDFAKDTDHNGVADDWAVTGSRTTGFKPTREQLPAPGGWAQLASCPPPAEGGQQPSVMYAQMGVPLQAGQWYRLALRAKADGFTGEVTVTVTNTEGWKSLFEYQRFRPQPAWKEHVFLVKPNATVAEKSRFQIWYEGAGTVALADVRIEPIRDPTVGRWLDGYYLDRPQEWDDPYRFFRW